MTLLKNFFVIAILLPSLCVANATNQLVEKFAKQNTINNMQVVLVNNHSISVKNIGTQTHYAINSMTKSFTALLLAYNVAHGKTRLQNKTENIEPAFKHSTFGQVTLLNLATHTSGLPFEMIDESKSVTKYLQLWKPQYPIGTRRIYSNNNIGVLGMLLADSNHKPYTQLLRNQILKPFGMHDTQINPNGFVNLPKQSIFIAADGIVSTGHDMGLFLQHMMLIKPNSAIMNKAINIALTGYYSTPDFTQALSWQEYNWPITENHFVGSATLEKLLNAPAKLIKGTNPHYHDKLILRTGLGHGYSSIMAFISAKKIGVVVLIHKEVSTQARYKLIYQLLEAMK